MAILGDAPAVRGVGELGVFMTRSPQGLDGLGQDATGQDATGLIVTATNTIGGIVSAIASIFGGGKDSTGLPRVPTNNRSFADNLAFKWYDLYLQRARDDNGWWTTQIMQDGPQRAWVNFSTSAEPQSKGVNQKATSYQAQGYGSQYELGPYYGGTVAMTGSPTGGTTPMGSGTTIPAGAYPVSSVRNPDGSTATTYSNGQVTTTNATGQLVNTSTAGMGSLSPTMLLVIGAAVIGAIVMMKRKGD
jgi:hypothetical protein